VRALAGYVEAVDGRTLVFALMVDGYHVPGAVAEALRDRVVERLALYRAGEEPAGKGSPGRGSPGNASPGKKPPEGEP
jgi:hypothetical protein